MIALLKYWKLIIAMALIIGAFTGGYKYATGEAAKDKIAALAKMKKEYQTKQGKVNETNQTQMDEIQSINNNLVDAISKLRRTSRTTARQSTTTCKGQTGASLSKEDATFLIRESARADKIRAALKAYYEYADIFNKEAE